MVFSSAVARTNADRRRAPRQACVLDAVVLPGRQSCTVVDRSGTGLRLQFRKTYDGPTIFVVVLLESGQALTVNARWRRDGEVGAQIMSRCELNGLVPGVFAEARQAWLRYKGADRPYNQRPKDQSDLLSDI